MPLPDAHPITALRPTATANRHDRRRLSGSTSPMTIPNQRLADIPHNNTPMLFSSGPITFATSMEGLMSRRRKILKYSLRRSPEYCMACRSAGRSLVLLAPLVRSDRRMKTGLRKIVLEVCIRVTVIMPGRGGLEKLSCEQTSVAKTKIQS